jgi:hypothetical protein
MELTALDQYNASSVIYWNFQMISPSSSHCSWIMGLLHKKTGLLQMFRQFQTTLRIPQGILTPSTRSKAGLVISRDAGTPLRVFSKSFI